MPDPRASFTFRDEKMGREADVAQAESAVLVADGRVFVAADADGAFAAWLELTRWLTKHMRPSVRWQAVCRALSSGEAAARQDKRPRGRDVSTASAMLGVVRDALGDDAYARVRKAAADRMMGRG